MTTTTRYGFDLQTWQRRIILVSWVTYAAYYLGRVNFSTAIPGLRNNLGLSSQDVGLLSTGFFLSYAVGQLVSGHLGDRLSPRRLVFLGMTLSTVMNLIFGSISIWGLMFVVWMLNGFLQSTGWAPVMKVLSNWHTPQQRRRVAGIYATSWVAGNMLTWLLSGWLVSWLHWRAAFWIPGSLMGLIAFIWYASIRDTPEEARIPPAALTTGMELDTSTKEDARSHMWGAFLRFWPLALAAVFGGFLLFALIVWMPTYFVDALALDIGTATSLASLLPLAGTLGTLAIGWLASTYLVNKEINSAALIFIGIGGLILLFPLASTSILASAIVLALVGGVLYGADTIITTILPMVMSGQKETASVAGLIDFTFNIGASLAGAIIGGIVDRYSWSLVFYTLAAGAILTSLSFIVFAWWRRR